MAYEKKKVTKIEEDEFDNVVEEQKLKMNFCAQKVTLCTNHACMPWPHP